MLKNQVKALCKHLLVPALASRPVSRFISRMVDRQVPVFMLHHITPDDDERNSAITTRQLRRYLGYLVENGYTFISLEHLITAIRNHETLPEQPVVFTLDDGFADQAEIAAPIFLEFDCPLTFFVITGMLDQALWPWDSQVSWITEVTRQPTLKIEIGSHPVELNLSDNNNRRQARRTLYNLLREMPTTQVAETVCKLARVAQVELPDKPPTPYQPMDWDMARTLERKGIRFAPHSVSHKILSKMDEHSVQQEILVSWKSMQQELENPLKVFCYPTGRWIDYGPREINFLKQEGFLGAVSTTSELVDPKTEQLFSLPRLSLPHSMEDFIQYCNWIESVKQSRSPYNIP